LSLEAIFNTTSWARGEPLSSIHSVWNRARRAGLAPALLRHRLWFLALCQAGLILCGLLGAWALRFNFALPDLWLLFSVAPILVAIRLTALAQFGLLHGWWRYTGVDDALAIVKAALAGSVVFLFCIRVLLGNAAFPRTVYVLEPLANILLLGGVRVFARLAAESLQRGPFPVKKVILIGAGRAAQAALREFTLPGSGYQAVGASMTIVRKRGSRSSACLSLRRWRACPRWWKNMASGKS
jgi:FlaA1/EpsC-like NDP-sugar epimerase